MNRQAGPERPDPVTADEATAGDARRRLRQRGIVPLEPDARIGVMLAPGDASLPSDAPSPLSAARTLMTPARLCTATCT